MNKFIVCLALVANISSGYVLMESFKSDYADYKREGMCTLYLAQQGYARSEINTSNGICWVNEK